MPGILLARLLRDAQLTLLMVVGEIWAFLVLTPWTWNGDGGPPGNRYFLSTYPLMVFLLLVLSIVTFALFNAVPTDPARLTCGKTCTPEIIAANRARLGLDQPIIVQYWDWLRAIFVGRTYGSGTATFACPAPCLGYSYRQQAPVTELIVNALPATFYLALGAFILWMAIGISTGIYAAKRRGTWQDRTVLGVTLVGYSMPVFFIGLLLLIFLIVRLNLLPYPDYISPLENPLQFLQTMILPWIALAILYAAYYTRLTRSQMLETLSEDFIRTARAKGLDERRVLYGHIFRNAMLIPISGLPAAMIGVLFTGSMLIEVIFSLDGIGLLGFEAALNRDYPVMFGTLYFFGLLGLLIGLLGDVLYTVIDPRIDFEARS